MKKKLHNMSLNELVTELENALKWLQKYVSNEKLERSSQVAKKVKLPKPAAPKKAAKKAVKKTAK